MTALAAAALDPPRPASGRGGSLVEGEFEFTAQDFRAVAAMLHADAGIALPENKVTLVYSRLAKRLRALGLRSFAEYCELVQEDGEERRQMLSALTTNVTRFYREPHHFDHLRTQLLPPLLEQAKRGGRVRLWSAACSTGQEPYSMALTVLALMPDAVKYDVRLLATDIDPVVLTEARRGRYEAAALAAVPAALRERWFEPVAGAPGTFEVREEVRQLITFRELNLIAPMPMRGPFQAVMCRNVVIYFDEPTQDGVWSRFAPLIEPGGALYIGHSERLGGPAAKLFRGDGITIHRRLEGHP